MIIVTGASRGIGRTISERLTANGSEVFALARDTKGLPFRSMNCDVSSYESVKAVARQMRKDGLSVSALINAAGIASMNLALTTPEDTTRKIIGTNLCGTIYCCQLFAPLMIRNNAGVIINFSTIAVRLGLQGESVYSASKAGVEAFTKVFGREVAAFNIRVNCIAPGPIQTDLLKGVTESQVSAIVSRQIIPKQFTTHSVADLIELLIDERSSSLSGEVLHVGGV